MIVLLLSVAGALLLYAIHTEIDKLRAKRPTSRCSVYHDIAEDDGDWMTRQPRQIRDFKDVYHLTMGLKSCTMNDLVLMDASYGSRIQLRRRLIEDNLGDVVGCNPVASEAVAELYQWLFLVYLPRRFPTAFQIVHDDKVKTKLVGVRNLTTNEMILPDCSNPEACLVTIGRHVDCEFAILLPTRDGRRAPFRASPTDDLDVLYHLHAFVLVFPAGFNTAQKLGMSLAGIHGPVPGYAAKMEKSMNRYFASLPFAKVVQRSNWGISTSGELFDPGRPRTDSAVAVGQVDWQEASRLVNPEQCFLRIERQTLHRLEQTGALVFGFKTYMEPMTAIKQEGLGPQLARAIEGLQRGSVPAMDAYKEGPVWRDRIVKFLRE